MNDLHQRVTIGLLQSGSPRQLRVEEVLYDPATFLRTFLSLPDNNLVFHAYNMQRQITFLSASAKTVLNVSPYRWKNRKFTLMMTDHPWNELMLSMSDTDLSMSKPTRCEIFSDEGLKIQIEVVRQTIFVDEEPVGVIGFSRVVAKMAEIAKNYQTSIDKGRDHPKLLSKWSSLTESERQVIELVVKGLMNKNIVKVLNIAQRTVEARRSAAMKKLGVRNVPELVRMYILIVEIHEK
jgi:DNA-binding CsgD family transcriptional regulator